MSGQISSIIYSNLGEWTIVRDNLYITIHNSIIRCIVDNKEEYNQMILLGLTEIQRLYLMGVLERELFNISENNEWAENTTFNLIYGIQGFLQGFIKTNRWKYIFKSLEPIDLANILYENIIWQLDDDLHSPCLLEDIPKYKCNKCNIIVDFLLNNNLCDNCVMIICD
jgi:hypothetical protein